ncbi:Bud site selection protein 6 [Wickerhamiella sorbophila]|uniref:Bud site selection protein 6 n=1 Tax=Wickerhamiella sorbophila TaxID=45607 RepID=A0A2T0FHK4_9ASCO|nr:Bud site selection protein 6 [Wickerhamiella sorbophila]PRT54465.1 Bud site selection protein 6 [Wickerhamiella sorbophila]
MPDERPESISTIESTVTRLLIYTKQLLESLTLWSRSQASEEDVSDVYVALGNEFNVACRSFMDAGIEVMDLGDVPQMLRVVLERALAGEASEDNLDHFLPQIREIIVNLLRQLKHKQNLLRHREYRGHRNSQASISSTNSSPRRASAGRDSHSSSRISDSPSRGSPAPSGPYIGHQPPKVTSAPTAKAAPSLTSAPAPNVATFARDPLAALQRSEALERRASKRYSQYHMSKIPGGPVPTTPVAGEQALLPTSTPHRSVPAEFTDATTVVDEVRKNKHLDSVPEMPQEPSEARRQSVKDISAPQSPAKGSMSSASIEPTPQPETGDKELDHKEPEAPEKAQEPVVSKLVTVFLRMGQRVRKAELEPPPSLAAIRLKFVETFSFNPSGGEMFPEMLIQDHKTGVEYELNEGTVGDVTEGSLITLLAKTQQESSLEKQVANLGDMMRELMVRMDGPSGRSASIPKPGPSRASPAMAGSPFVTQTTWKTKAPLNNVELLRQDVAVVRQISSETITNLKEELKTLKEQAHQLQNAQPGTQRDFMVQSRKKLSEDGNQLLTWIDDLQDIVEGQRKDVASRGVRLSPKQLEQVSKELLRAQSELSTMSSYMNREKPRWRRTWEQELNTVVEEQEFFQLQENLVNDMLSDLAKTRETFELVEQCSHEMARSDIKRNPILPPPAPEGPVEAMRRVHGEVAALKPDHDSRVQAIERAERLRKRELALRNGEFEQELGDYVHDNKLNKIGGIEETERRRQERDEKTRAEAVKSEQEAQEQMKKIKEERAKARAKAKEASTKDVEPSGESESQAEANGEAEADESGESEDESDSESDSESEHSNYESGHSD